MSHASALQPNEADGIFAALGDATRRAILKMVLQGPQSVSVLAGAIDVTLTAVSQHLRIMESCGLVRTRKVGRVRMCEADRRGLDVLADWVSLNRRMWEERFDRLDAMLRDEESPAT
ncbi:metalloregulator ArsR/SmtB family transcription factor [Massilia sp. G4R7]|uniref:Metalloregulator ArsR/SmtB family transcription factor n=1 Tax=Massilia phyllostachyos TaxID=2898585 RepID=A0ABS8Q1U9_9BURK|nr:metalloregulator ArsR/SmtB family transcription factor [Massilia phyllostachyos]MCD2515704.1 metalloregulator ArsR/SmtB family transcription factor [Massilia phyllostachyos]